MLSYDSMKPQPETPSPTPRRERGSAEPLPEQPKTLDYPSLRGMKRFDEAETESPPERQRQQQEPRRGRLKELDGTMAKMVPLLGENPTEQDLSAFREAMGIPQDPSGYSVDRSNWPTNMGPYPEGVEKNFLEVAHENNMTLSQIQSTYDFYMANLLTAPPREIDQEATWRQLEREWGSSVHTNVEIAKETLARHADSRLIEKIDASGLSDDPDFIRLFFKLGLETSAKGHRPSERESTDLGKDSYGRNRLSYSSM